MKKKLFDTSTVRAAKWAQTNQRRGVRRYHRGDAYLQKLPKKPRFFSAAAYSSSEWSLSHH